MEALVAMEVSARVLALEPVAVVAVVVATVAQVGALCLFAVSNSTTRGRCEPMAGTATQVETAAMAPILLAQVAPVASLVAVAVLGVAVLVAVAALCSC